MKLASAWLMTALAAVAFAGSTRKPRVSAALRKGDCSDDRWNTFALTGR